MGFFRQMVDFVGDAAGLEKTLRLIQALCQICAFYPGILGRLLLGMGTEGKDVDGKQMTVLEGLWRARRELAVGRRYLRFFRFIEHLSKAWDSLLNENGMKMLINVGKSGSMGAYLGLESLTILDVMDVCNTPWFRTCVLEGQKFWFYSLCISIFGGLYDLYLMHFNINTNPPPDSSSHENPIPSTSKLGEDAQAVQKQEEDSKRNEGNQKRKNRNKIVLKIIENIADLFVPGMVTGWIISDLGVVGCALIVSTVLSSWEIWGRVGERELEVNGSRKR
ncbi:c6563622-f4a6-4ab5-a8cb-cbc0a6598970 [Sclerotinia trifoliorum]|uniref:C6563622-f4a6-4ab5-a8cb-cbc0a6598970 n=1 Tax=Sclerotinia trifoliorum TaxID=28548 RepID=A0A8H2VRQ2_9HELO|nr:c6563622-f4a6-4ab5-a8cb-cbc0a6598970 [Sclerotinia trifoliorum]